MSTPDKIGRGPPSYIANIVLIHQKDLRVLLPFSDDATKARTLQRRTKDRGQMYSTGIIAGKAVNERAPSHRRAHGNGHVKTKRISLFYRPIPRQCGESPSLFFQPSRSPL